MATTTRDWDARSYERLAAPQEEWAREVLERMPLRGDETVLDAGCGSGRVTRLLIERLPKGRVIAVDGSPSMVEQVSEVLREQDQALVSDLLSLELSQAVDLVFSTATFHWIADHERLFGRLHQALRPGGRLVAQCGGEGNVAELSRAIREVNELPPFSSHLGGSPDPWNFASPEASCARLRAAGFEDERCWLEAKTVLPTEPRAFVATVCVVAELDQLPERLRDHYVGAVIERCESPLTLGYVRLNLDARRPK